MTRDAFPVVVHVLLWRAEELFLLRRANTGFMDGFYALPGGHQNRGEGVKDAAIRECFEETGVEVTQLQPVCVMPYVAGSLQGLNFLFEAQQWRGTPGINEPTLFDDCVWCSRDNLAKPHPAWLPDALKHRQSGDWFVEFEWD